MSERDREIGERLRNERKGASMTQKELGRAVGRAESSISEYEKGTVEMPRSVLENIAKALGADVNYLLHGKVIKMLEEQQKRDEEAAAPATQLSTDQLQKRVHTKVDNLTNKGLEKVDGYIDGLSEEEGYKLHWVEEGDK